MLSRHTTPLRSPLAPHRSVDFNASWSHESTPCANLFSTRSSSVPVRPGGAIRLTSSAPAAGSPNTKLPGLVKNGAALPQRARHGEKAAEKHFPFDARSLKEEDSITSNLALAAPALQGSAASQARNAPPPVIDSSPAGAKRTPVKGAPIDDDEYVTDANFKALLHRYPPRVANPLPATLGPEPCPITPHPSLFTAKLQHPFPQARAVPETPQPPARRVE